ncbi:MAG: T9SS type A sorting domain-containing protein [Muribaculaceae bacterium]|nr:T9SS type A sorting domain-containing protein [Muribaculaceae bacterium]
MKKLLLATLVCAGTLVPMAAQGIQFQTRGGDNLTGTTYVFEGYEENPQGKSKTEIFIDPHIYIYSETDVVVNIQAASNVQINLCAGGTCETGFTPIKENVTLKAGVPLNLNFDYTEVVANDELDSYQLPAIETVLTAWVTGDTSSVVTMTVKMGDVNAGVDSFEADKNSVVFNGHSLTYDVTGNSLLSVYSLSGKTVLNQAVAGNGSVGLESLSKGIYLYRLTNNKGQAVKSSKIIIK